MNVLVTGGASSGKSAYAEARALSLAGPHAYLATMQSGGAEAEARIARHRSLRAGKGFETFECACGLDGFELPRAFAGGTVLLEDLGNLVANEMWGGAMENALPGVRNVAGQCANLVIVTNEVGADGASHDPDTRAYIEALGALSCALAAEFDEVVEVAAGVPFVVKGAGASQGVQEPPATKAVAR